MKTLQIQGFKYTSIDHPDDVTSMPLMKNLFGLNNRIYANLGSYSCDFNTDDAVKYRDVFNTKELRFDCLNRLFQMHFHYRENNKDWETIESIDFTDLFEFIKGNHHKWDRCNMSFNDAGDKSDNDLGVLCLPLGSDIIMNASNYAFQQIELIKMENVIMHPENSKHLSNFISIF